MNSTAPDGSAWDVGSGLPDPFVCMTLSGTRMCTRVLSDTLRPRWEEALFSGLTATTLLSSLRAGFRVEYYDSDIASNDLICAGTITEDRMSLGGTFGVMCGDGVSSITFRIDPTD